MNPCTRRNFLATTGAAALAAASPATALAASRPPVRVAPFTAAQWRRVVTTDFGQDVPLGHFPGSAPGWSAFHHGSLDTAAKRGLKPGGIYDPGSTTWVSGGYLHVRQWRAASGGPVHCSTPYLLAARNVLYGRFVEVTRVSRPAVGYKSAH